MGNTPEAARGKGGKAPLPGSHVKELCQILPAASAISEETVVGSGSGDSDISDTDSEVRLVML